MYEHHTSERPPIIEKIRAEMRGEVYQPAKPKKQEPLPPDPEDLHALFHVATGNRWMELGERESEAKMLFGEFWHQHELCILFADTNTGKSILAVQIAESIARRRKIDAFAIDARPGNVLYVDFELSTRQFRARYTGTAGDYNFSDHFLRAQFIPDAQLPGYGENHDRFLLDAIEYKINLVNAKVLIIDNITCVRGGTANAATALTLIKQLARLKATHQLSILVLAHTPKRRNPGRPISPDDLQGSKMLINFADSAFAIGSSQTDPKLRYLKQVKQRNAQQCYGEDNVCLCRIKKQGSFLRIAFEGHSPEAPHLRSKAPQLALADRMLLATEAARLSADGQTQRRFFGCE
jgi:AAA domain